MASIKPLCFGTSGGSLLLAGIYVEDAGQPVVTTILLVRHAAHDDLGRVLSGRSSTPLNRNGERQALRLARHLQQDMIGRIEASPCLRTQQTASIIGGQIGLEVKAVAALDEIDFGEWTGRTFSELADDPLWDAWNSARATAVPPRGEGMAAAVERTVAHLEGKAGADEGTALCVTHGDVIRGVVCHYLGVDLDHIHRFDVDPASVTRLELFPGAARLSYINRAFA